MNFKTRTNNITKILYVILVLCIVGIMVLSVYSLFNQNNPNNLKNNNSLDNNNAADVNSNKNDVLANETTAVLANETTAVLANDAADSNTIAEDVLGDIRRQQTTAITTQPQTKPAATQRADAAAPALAATDIVKSAAPPVINQDDQLITPTEKKADSVADQTEKAVEVISVPAVSVFVKPLNGNISKQYNPDTPEYSVAMNDYRTHIGIDIDSDIGANVKAVSDGVIAEVTDDPLMGKTVVINHANGVQSIYMNLQEAVPKNITAGAQVKAGDVIGGVGDTSLIESTDVPHLHFEMKKDGSYVNPTDYINF